MVYTLLMFYVVWHLVSIANSAVQFMVLLGIKSMRKTFYSHKVKPECYLFQVSITEANSRGMGLISVQ